MTECDFCGIAEGRVDAALLFGEAGLVAFADTAPIRPGHVQIIPRAHVETFEALPEALAGALIEAGQRVARAQKRLYGVARVGFVITGGDVAHCHAHVVPLRDKTDITSLRYFEAAELVPAERARPHADTLRAEMAALSAALERQP